MVPLATTETLVHAKTLVKVAIALVALRWYVAPQTNVTTLALVTLPRVHVLILLNRMERGALTATPARKMTIVSLEAVRATILSFVLLLINVTMRVYVIPPAVCVVTLPRPTAPLATMETHVLRLTPASAVPALVVTL